MKYLCLCYYDVDVFKRLTPGESAAIGPACAPHDAILNATGKVRITGSLRMPDAWSHFVPRDGRPELHAGPFLEGPRHPGAFLVVDADSDEEARSIASKHATAHVGEHLGFAIEVMGCEFYRES